MIVRRLMLVASSLGSSSLMMAMLVSLSLSLALGMIAMGITTTEATPLSSLSPVMKVMLGHVMAETHHAAVVHEHVHNIHTTHDDADLAAPFTSCPSWNRYRTSSSLPTPNITIGSFDNPGEILPSSLITDALANLSSPNLYPYVIALGPNIFNGTAVFLSVDNVALIGCGQEQTFITAALGLGIVEATLTITANNVTLELLQVANTWDDPWELGPNPPPIPKNVTYSQAVALKLQGERTALRDVYLYGYQDTLYTVSGTAYLYNCTILGRVDFIFGSGVLFIESSRIDAIPGGYITAGSTPADQTYGTVFVNCRVTFNSSYGHNPKGSVGLGRTWHAYPMVTYINTTIDGPYTSVLDHPWIKMGNESLNGTGPSPCHARLAEYNTMFSDGSTKYVQDHPASCPLASSPIVAATQLPEELQAFYEKSTVLGGWDPSSESVLLEVLSWSSSEWGRVLDGEGDEAFSPPLSIMQCLHQRQAHDDEDRSDADDAATASLFPPTAHCPPWNDPRRLPPNVTLGSFDSFDANAFDSNATTYPTSLIMAALESVPTPNLYPFVIALAPGVFLGEPLFIRVGNVSMIGCGAERTFLRYANSTNLSPTLPVYYDVATLIIEASDVTIEHVHVANTWNDPWELGPDPPPTPKNVSRTQAVALVVNAERIAIRHSYIYGFQDTLLTASGMAYMYNCTVLGCVDFIFGAGTLFIERSHIDAIPGGWITAMMTPANVTYGAVFESCWITRNSSYGHRKMTSGVGLGRSWHQFPFATYINTTIETSDTLLEHPWTSMGNESIVGNGTSVCHSRFAEYNTILPDGSTTYTVQHPKSCPLTPSPIVAEVALPGKLVEFYSKQAVLGGWNPPAYGTEASYSSGGHDDEVSDDWNAGVVDM